MSRRAKPQTIETAAVGEDNAARFAESLGITFHDMDLLRLALTHRSVAHELR